MSTTTIRIADDLKTRVAAVAQASGLTAHGFILQAIEQQTAQAEAQAQFERLADQRWKRFQRTGMAITFEEARQYMLDLAAGKKVARPRARKIDAAADADSAPAMTGKA